MWIRVIDGRNDPNQADADFFTIFNFICQHKTERHCFTHNLGINFFIDPFFSSGSKFVEANRKSILLRVPAETHQVDITQWRSSA